MPFGFLVRLHPLLLFKISPFRVSVVLIRVGLYLKKIILSKKIIFYCLDKTVLLFFNPWLSLGYKVPIS